jgi:hypothetical protein
MEHEMNAREIVQRKGMNPDPASYAGRGATTRDLTSTTLRRICEGIKDAFGESAATSFVSLVRAVPTLSAEAFLVALYRLEAEGWRWSPHVLRDDIEMIRISSVSAPLASSVPQRDETNYIRGEFLERIATAQATPDYDPFSW